MISGSCLCKQIQFESAGPIHMLNHCHCSMCRKSHGAAFGSFLHVDADSVRWVTGTKLISIYRTAQQDDRCFCRICGSNVPVIEEDNNVIIPAGTLDICPDIKPIMHIFTASKASWFTISDSLPQFDEFPPDDWLTKTLERK